MVRRLLITLAAWLAVAAVFAQERENNWLAFPVAFRSPETGNGFGAAGAYTFYTNKADSASPASIVQAGFAFTEKRQFFVYAPFQLFWDARRWWVHGQVEVYDFNYLFFGVGNGDFSAERYDTRFDRFRINVLRQIRNNVYLGPRLWIENWRFSGFRSRGMLDSGTVSGSEGGLTFDPGVVFFVDGRDNVFFPTRGHLIEAVTQHAFGDYNFSRYRLDARLYTPVLDGLVWANQLFVDHTTGNVPFYMMAQLGGTGRMRGYYEGRFRDKNAVLVQTELRLKVYRRWGLNGFWSTGAVAEAPGELTRSVYRNAGGLGLRFTADRKKNLNLRLDAAWGRGSSGLYFTVGEAF